MYRLPRGTADILPSEQAYWRYIEKQAVALCQRYGYERIDTPIFEEAGLFIRSIGEETDIVEKEMYIFQDRGGKRLTLKPEGTASVCRAYLEHGLTNLPQPVRLYYFSPIFRYERPQAGRYRQHHQFGCEALGEADPALDAEVIELAWQFFHSLGLRQLRLEINSIGCRRCRPNYREGLKQYYSAHIPRLCPDCQRRWERNPLRLLDCKQPICLEVAEAAPQSLEFLCQECREHFQHLERYLNLVELPFRINHRLVRGLDYYTRTVFELLPLAGGAQSTLGGGGRYDDLIEELGGRPTPAVGFASGLERMVRQLKEENIPIPPLSQPQVFLAPIGELAREEALKLASTLRGLGVGVMVASGSRSLKAQLRQAHARHFPWAILLGEEELKSGILLLRDMLRGEERRIPRGEINTWVKMWLGDPSP